MAKAITKDITEMNRMAKENEDKLSETRMNIREMIGYVRGFKEGYDLCEERNN